MDVVGVISGKGGVGKTTTVANLGVTMAFKFERKILIVDGNFATPDLGLHLGMYSFPHNLLDVLKKDILIDEAIYKHPSGVDVLPSSLSYYKVDVDIHDLKGYLHELKDYEFVLIDSPPGLGGEISPILKICDKLLVVTNPEIPAITDSLRAIEISNKMKVPIWGIVLNRIRRERYELSILEVESVFDVPVVATIPEDAKVRESIALGNPVSLNYPYSPSATEFTKFGAYLIGEEYSLGFFTKIKRWFKKKTRRGVKKGVLEKMALEKPVATEEALDIEVGKGVPEAEEGKSVGEIRMAMDEEKTPSLESAFAQLNSRKEVIESMLDKLEKKYNGGLINKPTYNRIGEGYRSELQECKKEIKKIESKLKSKAA